jgi:modulator of FtsH protease
MGTPPSSVQTLQPEQMAAGVDDGDRHGPLVLEGFGFGGCRHGLDIVEAENGLCFHGARRYLLTGYPAIGVRGISALTRPFRIRARGPVAIPLSEVDTMNQGVQNFPGLAGGGALAAQRNRVLRNTYWLLALSMVPTVLGAWVGMAIGINRILTPGIGLIVFLAGAFGFMFAIEKFKNSAAGVPILLGFTFFMGIMLSRMLAVVLGMNNGTSLVMMAFAGTGAIFLGMATMSSIVKRDLTNMAKFMFIGVILLLVAGIANFFIQSSALMITLAVAAIGIFSFFILYDLKRVQDGEETNYITATLGVYLSIYNVFQSLLALFGIAGSSND